MDVLWKPRRQATGKGRGKVKKIVTEDERLHSLDAARLLDNTLRVGLGRRLSEFKMATPRIERLVDLVKEHKLSLEILALEFPFLALWMDKEFLTMWNYLGVRERCIVINFGDPVCHGLWNSLKNGAKASGHLYLLSESGCMLNYNAGPWGSCEWLDKTWSAGLQMYATLKPNDRLLGKLFVGISEEANLPNSLASKKYFVKNKCEQHAYKKSMAKSEMFRLSEWFGWVKRWKVAIDTWHSLLLLFTFIGIMQGYVRSAMDIFGPATARGDIVFIPEPPVREEQEQAAPATEDAPEPDAAAIEVDPPANEAASSSNDPPPAAKAKGAARKTDEGAKRRKIDVKALRKKARNTLHFVMEMLCSRWLRANIQMMLLVYTILQEEHSSLVVYCMQGSQHVRRVYAAWALGSWKKTVVRVFKAAGNMDGLRRCTFDISLTPFAPNEKVDAETLAYQDGLAVELFLMILGQVTFRTIEGFLQSFTMPAMFAAFTMGGTDRPAIRSRWLHRIRASLKAFLKYADNTETDIKKMVGRSFWRTGLGIVVRVILEHGDDREIDILIAYCELLFTGVGLTKVNEDANKFVKEVVLRLRASTKARLAVLWSLAHLKKLAATYTRNEMPIHTTMPVNKEFPDGFFEPCAEGVKSEAGENQLDLASMAAKHNDWTLLKGPDWIALSAEDQILQAWDRANIAMPERLFQVDLVPEWEVLRDRLNYWNTFFVLHVVTHRALIVIDVEVDFYGFFTMPQTVQQYRPYYKLVNDVHELTVIPTRKRSPYGVRRSVQLLVTKQLAAKTTFVVKQMRGFRGPVPFVPPDQVEKQGVKLEWDPNAREESLLKWQAARGFKGVKTDTMDKLVKKLGVEADVAQAAEEDAFETEEAKALALMISITSDMSLLDAQLALQERRSRRRGNYDTAGLRALMDSDVLRDLLVQEDLGIVREMVEDAEAEDAEYDEARRNAKKHVQSTFRKVFSKAEFKDMENEYTVATSGRPWTALEVDDSDMAIIGKLSPPLPVKVEKLKRVGYYLVTYKNVYERSYSWTWIRTPKRALLLTLVKAWEVAGKKLGIYASQQTLDAIHTIEDRDIPGLPE